MGKKTHLIKAPMLTEDYYLNKVALEYYNFNGRFKRKPRVIDMLDIARMKPTYQEIRKELKKRCGVVTPRDIE